jgi:maltose-binding protein MalE
MKSRWLRLLAVLAVLALVAAACGGDSGGDGGDGGTDDTEAGEDFADAQAIDVFYFPGNGTEKPVLSAGVVAVAFTDRPEVMEFMKWLGGPGFAEARQKYQAETQGGTSGYLSAAAGQDMSVYNDFETGLIEILQSADVARFDGSDLMPSAVGAGTFWTEATAAVNGDKTVDEATQTVEDSWPDSGGASSGGYTPVAGEDTGFITVQGSETSDAEAGSNEKAFNDYGAEAGVTVSFAGSRSFSDNINIAVAAGNPPDVGFIPQPGKVADFARNGSIVQLPDDVVQANQDAYGTFADFGVVDGAQYGVTVKTDLKSLVWYKPDRFAEAGYAVPETFDDLVALTDQMIADGETPWCVGIESGGATGWAFTDWVEDLMLRLHGADVYDQWVSHEIPFNDDRVKEAWQTVLDLWNKDGAVYAAGGAIATTSFSDNALPLEEDECWMHRQANFFASFFTPGYPIGPQG